MKENQISEALGLETLKDHIYIIRGKKVMLDRDLAMLYRVPTKRLNEAVKRNIKRFPPDFMFQLSKEQSGLFSRSQIATLAEGEDDSLRSQFATSKKGRFQGLRSQFVTLKLPSPNLKSQFATSNRGGRTWGVYAFTEQGIAMLSSVLKSDRAIQVNIQIIRVFTKLREMIDAYKELREKVEEMEKNNEITFQEIFRVLRLIVKQEEEPKHQIGYRVD